jgi:hypothetical protein
MCANAKQDETERHAITDRLQLSVPGSPAVARADISNEQACQRCDAPSTPPVSPSVPFQASKVVIETLSFLPQLRSSQHSEASALVHTFYS